MKVTHGLSSVMSLYYVTKVKLRYVHFVGICEKSLNVKFSFREKFRVNFLKNPRKFRFFSFFYHYYFPCFVVL